MYDIAIKTHEQLIQLLAMPMQSKVSTNKDSRCLSLKHGEDAKNKQSCVDVPCMSNMRERRAIQKAPGWNIVMILCIASYKHTY
jgi:hypothetical protein